MSKIPEVFFSVLALGLLTVAGCSSSGEPESAPEPTRKPAPQETIFEGDHYGYGPFVRAFCDGSTRVYVTWSENSGDVGTVVTVVAKSPECEAK